MATKTNSFRSLIAASGQTPHTAAVIETEQVKVRTSGKRNDADYVQVGLYLPRKLHRKAKLALLEDGEERDFSELVAEILQAYLDRKATE